MLADMTPADGDAAIDRRELRRALGRFVTGVTVLTALDGDGRLRGLTANSFTSVSLDPPLVLVCIDHRTASHDVFESTEGFVVNILADDQTELANRFASSGADKFEDVAMVGRRGGPPVLDGCTAWLQCDVESRFPAGDHLVVIGRVREFATEDAQPLAFCQGAYVSLLPDRIEALGAGDGKVVVAWLVESDERIVLADDPAAGGLDLPTSRWSDTRLDDEGLAGLFAGEFGVPGDVQSLFSVFDDHERGVLTLIYRAQARDELASRDGLHGFPPGDLPWPRISRRHVRETLQRYLNERVVNRFGIYAGSLEQGLVSEIHATQSSDSVWTS
jgi:flavin-dependent trigonelline monooxygenase, reductase component